MMTRKTRLAVCPQNPGDGEDCRHAQALAAELGLPFLRHFVPHGDRSAQWDLLLRVADRPLGLEVVSDEPALATVRGGRLVTWSFADLDVHSGPGRRGNQPIYKAIGLFRGKQPPPRVLDVTAGFGHDACLLASAGCRVTMLERHRVIACLLRESLAQLHSTAPAIADRMHLQEGDALSVLADMNPVDAPEVIYLDPMFPPLRRTTERKAMRVMRLLAGEDPDAPALLELALSKARRRVVVKRPLRAPMVTAAVAPEISHKGQAVRYDVYPVV